MSFRFKRHTDIYYLEMLNVLCLFLIKTVDFTSCVWIEVGHAGNHYWLQSRSGSLGLDGLDDVFPVQEAHWYLLFGNVERVMFVSDKDWTTSRLLNLEVVQSLSETNITRSTFPNSRYQCASWTGKTLGMLTLAIEAVEAKRPASALEPIMIASVSHFNPHARGKISALRWPDYPEIVSLCNNL
jgi:hypothetical protein